MIESSHNLKIWAKIEALKVSVEAMKVMNQNRESNGLGQAYDESRFWEASQEIERLSESFE